MHTPRALLLLAILAPFMPGPGQAIAYGYGISPVRLGRVVQLADGTYALFSGWRTDDLPADLLPQLAPYVGQHVKITCTLTDVPTDPWICGGGTISAFEKIEVVEPPLQIVVAPTKATYQLDEPIVVNITITNQSQQAQLLDLPSGVTALCQNYRGRQQLEGLAHLADLTPYDLPVANDARMIEPGEVVTFTVTSAYMVEPGEYQLLFYMRYTYSPSEITAVTVAPPADDDAHHAALAKWIDIAQPDQCQVIARELIEKFDDPQGVDIVLKLMTNTSWQGILRQPLFGCQFAWQYGGWDGADIMTKKIQSMMDSSRIRTALDYGIALSPYRLESLAELLACKTLIKYAPTDWAEIPRVCDVVAYWLADDSDELTFPIDGDQAARDEAIAAIAAQLEEDPAAFTVLQDDPADQQPQDTPPGDN